MRTLDISSYKGPLDKIITHELIPTIFGCPVSPIHHADSLSLPLKDGGMGISSKKRTCCIAPGEWGLTNLLLQLTRNPQMSFNVFLNINLATRRRGLEHINEPGSSNWLSCLPLRKHGFILNKSEFRDSIRLQYNLHHHSVHAEKRLM